MMEGKNKAQGGGAEVVQGSQIGSLVTGGNTHDEGRPGVTINHCDILSP